ncbi:MAG: translation initiation factor IF-1 [Gloeobacteraceae cyanobacterium ES-bin-144]|nr:translation initiation factor IF-1 [Verrucomicrobiales bacterium]
MSDASIHTVGRVLDKLGPVLYRVVLPNGKIILAHLSKHQAAEKSEFVVEDEVLVELTPFDFDSGRILGFGS